MSEVEGCPFCGLDGETLAWRDKNGDVELIEHPNTDCILADIRTDNLEQWNARQQLAAARSEVTDEQARAIAEAMKECIYALSGKHVLVLTMLDVIKQAANGAAGGEG